jgi:hypothetical protein
MLKQSNTLCKDLHKTYNTYLLNNYPKLKDIFIEVRDLYEKNPLKFKKANKILMSLIYNLVNPEKIPIVDYITGPGEISKWESKKYNKIIYIFGENDHSNITGCSLANKNDQVNLSGKKHMYIQDYLLKLFKNSPVFIDFYIEFGVMLDNLETINTTTGQTLWDMFAVMYGCFGPGTRDCEYNVRMHSVDARSIKSRRHSSSNLSNMGTVVMMQNVLNKKGMEYIPLRNFKILFKREIEMLSNIKNNKDLINIIIDDIKNNTLLMKELDRSTLSFSKIVDFLVKKSLSKFFSDYPDSSKMLREWCKKIKDSNKWLSNTKLQWVNFILTPINATTMDVYTITRMFKIFNVKDSEFYPKEPHNIIYYAGSGHTDPIAGFLKSIGFQRTEHSDGEILSCVSMKSINQPLFS